ncbi:hypothetical protein [Phormidesmis priestleyi]|nr:hypothetical protein [Phormidesmis priestleyi]
MNNFRQRLEGLMGKMVIAIIVMTCINFVLVGIRYQQSRTKLDKAVASFEQSGLLPEVALASLDGKDSKQPEVVRPYAELLNQLEAKCIEPRTELMGISRALTKHERKQQQEVTYLEGLQELMSDVESGFEKFPATCMEAYSYHVQASQQ